MPGEDNANGNKRMLRILNHDPYTKFMNSKPVSAKKTLIQGMDQFVSQMVQAAVWHWCMIVNLF
jgi:hypothetical protein